MAATPLPPAAILRKIFDYDPETGQLFWKARTLDMFPETKRRAEWMCAAWNTRHAHKPALTHTTEKGYRRGQLRGRLVMAHRVIWKMMYDTEPNEVDHINGNKSDNRIVNLRSATRQENVRNTRLRHDNKTGVHGVYVEGKKWVAYIRDGKQSIRLGLFSTIQEATEARKVAELNYGYHANHGRSL